MTLTTATAPRIFALATPHMKGSDIEAFQRELTKRFEAWTINRQLVADGDYGPDTRAAAQDVCIGLGIGREVVMGHGVTPELRVKIRHPETRTEVEKARAEGEAAKQFRAALRRRFDAVGQVVVAADANKPGQPIQKVTLDYVGRMAARLGKRIVITTGTNHRKFASPGVISDHFTGHAVDLGMIANGGSNDSPVGDRIMTVALIEAGFGSDDAAARARAGGLFTLAHAGLRIQCIWKAPEHHDHVHVGVRPA
jgi:hypothetical protein